MAQRAPYQPALLRLLHGAMVLLVPLASLTGAVVFSNHDGRWWRLPVQVPGDWIDLHGSVGVMLWPLTLLFVIYALSLGRQRLSRAANAAALIGLVLAVGSGKLMEEDWLRSGELDHAVYHLHLLSWLLITGAVIWHVLAALQRGGLSLAASMFRLERRPSDQPWRLGR
ncbi:cytochrome b/b6 domain-containing protein [Vulcanococcus sp.]|jgi:hypothetical protein|uniref:cytochrome b/b6 domain-containing protein n=1 Tax=Vulcanococcus sp. TaxID=2856995 RepID=UPI003C072B50